MTAGRPYGDFAGIYDDLMQGRFVRHWWRRFCGLAAELGWHYASVVDLAGGTGEAAQYFAGRHRPLYIVDRSAAMLQRARRRVPSAQCLQQDLRRLRLPVRVDLAVVVFGGMNYLPTRRSLAQACCRIYRSLKPGGIFCLDAVTPHRLRQILREGPVYLSGPHFASSWRYAWLPGRRALSIRVDSFEYRDASWRRHPLETHVHYAYTLADWRWALGRAGFRDVVARDLGTGGRAAGHNEYWLIGART